MKMNNDEYYKVYEGGDETRQIDFVEDIDLIERETKWITLPLANLCVKNIIGPMFAEKFLDDYNIYGNDLDTLLSTVTDGSAMGYPRGSQFMVGSIDPITSHKTYYLLSINGFDQLVSLIGSSCPAFYRRTNEKKEEDLNYDLRTVGGKEIQVQLVAGKIQTAHSSSYVILKKDKMLYGITDILDEKFDGYEFCGGYYSHTGIGAKWAFPKQAEEILGLYTGKGKKYDERLFSDAVPVIKFRTSDVGDSCATLGAYLEKPKRYSMKIGDIIKVWHKGQSTEQDVIDACDGLFAQFRDMAAALVKLTEIEVKNPINAMLNIGVNVCSLHKVQLIKAIEEYKEMYDEDYKATGEDVFFVLQRALNNMRVSEKKVTEKKIEDCEEALLKMLSPAFAWDAYDTSIVTANMAKDE